MKIFESLKPFTYERATIKYIKARLLPLECYDQFQHRNTQETLAVLDRLDLDTDKPSDEEVAKRFGYEDEYYSGNNLEVMKCLMCVCR